MNNPLWSFFAQYKNRSSKVKKNTPQRGFCSLGFSVLDFLKLRFDKPCTQGPMNFRVFAYLFLLTGLIYSGAYVSMA